MVFDSVWAMGCFQWGGVCGIIYLLHCIFNTLEHNQLLGLNTSNFYSVWHSSGWLLTSSLPGAKHVVFSWKKVRLYQCFLAQKSFQMNAQQTLHPFKASHAQLIVQVGSDKYQLSDDELVGNFAILWAYKRGSISHYVNSEDLEGEKCL